MVLRFGATKAEDVAGLIAKKNYSRAIEVIREQLKSGKPDARLRMQLGDVLIMAGRGNASCSQRLRQGIVTGIMLRHAVNDLHDSRGFPFRLMQAQFSAAASGRRERQFPHIQSSLA